MSVYRFGSSGEQVLRIQERLRRAGIYLGPQDGVFGGGTVAAVKLFQGMEGLYADGVVGPRTWQALFNEDIPTNALWSEEAMQDLVVGNGEERESV